VFIASAILWYLLRHVADTNPIWAIASMVAASDPHVKEAVHMFRARIINVLVGCAVGLLFLVVGGSREWKLPLALAVTVLVSSYLIHIQTMWRQAPITAARAWASSRPSVRRIVVSVGTAQRPVRGSRRAPSAARTGWGASAAHSAIAVSDRAPASTAAAARPGWRPAGGGARRGPWGR